MSKPTFFPILIWVERYESTRVCKSPVSVPHGIAFVVLETNCDPKLKLWQIWCEGYQATGESGKAHKYCDVHAKTFKDACITYMKFRRDLLPHFDEDRLSVWGCRLFSCERAARELCG